MNKNINETSIINVNVAIYVNKLFYYYNHVSDCVPRPVQEWNVLTYGKLSFLFWNQREYMMRSLVSQPLLKKHLTGVTEQNGKNMINNSNRDLQYLMYQPRLSRSYVYKRVQTQMLQLLFKPTQFSLIKRSIFWLQNLKTLSYFSQRRQKPQHYYFTFVGLVTKKQTNAQPVLSITNNVFANMCYYGSLKCLVLIGQS